LAHEPERLADAGVGLNGLGVADRDDLAAGVEVLRETGDKGDFDYR
jgi:hypothetical protein